jgi:hypothetical protein
LKVFSAAAAGAAHVANTTKMISTRLIAGLLRLSAADPKPDV